MTLTSTNKSENLSVPSIVILVFLAALWRILPHWPNFTPVASIGLLGAAYLPKKSWAIILPLVAMFLSDLILGLHAGLPFVYGAIALGSVVGFALRSSVTLSKLAGASFLSSLIFFFITNFGVWLTSGMYELSFRGLINSYVLALPFFQNTVISGLLFAAILFGLYNIKIRRPLSVISKA